MMWKVWCLCYRILCGLQSLVGYRNKIISCSQKQELNLTLKTLNCVLFGVAFLFSYMHGSWMCSNNESLFVLSNDMGLMKVDSRMTYYWNNVL